VRCSYVAQARGEGVLCVCLEEENRWYAMILLVFSSSSWQDKTLFLPNTCITTEPEVLVRDRHIQVDGNSPVEKSLRREGGRREPIPLLCGPG